MKTDEIRLTFVPTPIGNLEDMTLRGIRVLREADVIACEDTRHTGKLLEHYRVSAKVLSYHEHNERKRAEEILDMVEDGKKVAVVSDAGMPGISDPGAVLVEKAIERKIPFTVLPGPSAFLVALVASGEPLENFAYYGFLSREKKTRRKEMESLIRETRTSVFYEAPHRIARTLEELSRLSPGRRVVLCRELTKIHEEIFRGTLEEALQRVGEEARGEFAVVLSPAEPKPAFDEEDITREMEYAFRKGLSAKEASENLAERFGLSKNDLYRLYLKMKTSSPRVSDDRSNKL